MAGEVLAFCIPRTFCIVSHSVDYVDDNAYTLFSIVASMKLNIAENLFCVQIKWGSVKVSLFGRMETVSHLLSMWRMSYAHDLYVFCFDLLIWKCFLWIRKIYLPMFGTNI